MVDYTETYDSKHRVRIRTFDNGVRVVWNYDRAGHVIRNEATQGETRIYETMHTYDDEGRLRSTTSTLGRGTHETVYDDHGNPIGQVTRGLGPIVPRNGRFGMSELGRRIYRGDGKTADLRDMDLSEWELGLLREIQDDLPELKVLLSNTDLVQRAVLEGRGEYVVDDQGRLAGKVFKDANGKVQWIHECTYDEKGKRTSEVRKDANGKVTGSWESTYDEKGNATSCVYKDANGKVTRSWEYTYDEKGHETSGVEKDANGKVIESWEYTYDEKGNQTSCVVKDANDKVKWIHESTYDEKGHETSHVYKDANAKVEWSREHTYDEKGNRTSSVEKDANGKVEWSVEYTYDEKGNETSEVYKDAKGKVTGGWGPAYEQAMKLQNKAEGVKRAKRQIDNGKGVDEVFKKMTEANKEKGPTNKQRQIDNGKGIDDKIKAMAKREQEKTITKTEKNTLSGGVPRKGRQAGE